MYFPASIYSEDDFSDSDFLKKVDSLYLKELIHLGYTDLHHISEGSFKRVYSAKKEGATFAIKVMGGETGPSEKKGYSRFLNTIQNDKCPQVLKSQFIDSELREEDLREEIARSYTIQQYARFIRKHKFPFFVYEINELYSMNLEKFFKHEEWTWNDYKYIYHQVVEGIYFFHKHAILITDLKLKNLMIDTSNKKVVFIDYWCAKYRCNYHRCKDDDDRSCHTITDPFNKDDLYQDIFRLGFMMIQSIIVKFHLKDYKEFLKRYISKLSERCTDYNLSFYTKSECIEHSKEEYEFSLEKYMNEVEHLLQKEQRKRLISKRDVEDLVEVIDSCLNSDRHSRMTVEELMIYPYFEVKKSHSKSSKSKKKKASATKKRSRKVSKIGNFYTV